MSAARSANDSGSPINVPGQTERAPQTLPAMDASGAISITENTRFLVSNTDALNPVCIVRSHQNPVRFLAAQLGKSLYLPGTRLSAAHHLSYLAPADHQRHQAHYSLHRQSASSLWQRLCSSLGVCW
ncbi:hypothetical protein IG631_03280 [Alternaria alternata]|nr:hypothetical protein IG631_03280 [Alternaria alternata]